MGSLRDREVARYTETSFSVKGGEDTLDTAGFISLGYEIMSFELSNIMQAV